MAGQVSPFNLRHIVSAIIGWRQEPVIGAFVLGIMVAGCGYQMEKPRLPGGARNLSVAVIHNRTFTGEVDVRLRRELRRLLYRDAGIHVTPHEQSQLSLEISIRKLTIIRRTSLQNTSVTSLAYRLSGKISLIDTDTGELLIDEHPIATTTRLVFSQAQLETPAIRDEVLSDALKVFSQLIVDRLLLSF